MRMTKLSEGGFQATVSPAAPGWRAVNSGRTPAVVTTTNNATVKASPSKDVQHTDGPQRPRKQRRLPTVATGFPTDPEAPEALEVAAIAQPTTTSQESPLHPGDQAPSMSTIARQIQVAASEAWDCRFRYHDVSVLLLAWEEDEKSTSPEFAHLEETFRCVYNYKTEIWKIPTRSPERDIKERLLSFLSANDAEDTLVIIYYTGHAMPNSHPQEAPLWSPRHSHGNTMFSGNMKSMAQEARADFLLLLDCPDVQPARDQFKRAGHNVAEVISASEFDAVAADPDAGSFTHHLDMTLTVAARYGPIKCARLHAEIVGSMFPQTPHRGPRTTKNAADDSEAGEETHPRGFPLYYGLSGQPRSITLAPLTLRDASNSLSGNTSNKSENSMKGTKANAILPGRQSETPQALVCFRVAGANPEPVAWATALQDAPLEVRDFIEIEGFWGSFPSILMVRMPAQVWNLLPASSAATFIGYTTSDNEGVRFQRRVDSLLTIADKRDRSGAAGSGDPDAAPLPSRTSRTRKRKRAVAGPPLSYFGEPSAQTKKGIRIGNAEDVWNFYDQRFRYLQQNACKLLAKAWVKIIAPKKQSHYPYTSGERGAPAWWPKPWGPTKEDRVRHLEPDHLLKRERVHLLKHILRLIIEPNESQHPDIQVLNLNVAKLEDATTDALSGFLNGSENGSAMKRLYLREIFNVARYEEQYRKGVIDANIEVFVTTDCKPARGSQSGDEG